MTDRPYLSIGEVLELLRDEFPDITISKIRFLESQGLLEPERTASGYRKFYDADVERLRFILRQQREKYLPLKVIRDQLEEAFGPVVALPSDAATTATPSPAVPRPSRDGAPAARGNGAGPARAERSETAPDTPVRLPGPPASAAARVGGGERAGSADRTAAAVPSPREAARALLAGVASGISLTFDELVSASGLTADDVRQLESFGLVSGHPVFSATYYDEEALLVAKLAAGFRRYGVEPRHLRMYKTAADREAAFLEQVVTPLVRRRTPETRHQALEAIGELVKLGEQLRAVALRRVLRSAVDQG